MLFSQALRWNAKSLCQRSAQSPEGIKERLGEGEESVGEKRPEKGVGEADLTEKIKG